MDSLQYSRQFLFSSKECPKFDSWQLEYIGLYYIYTHDYCELTKVTNRDFEIILIGYILDPNGSDLSNEEILLDLLNIKSIDEVPLKLYSLTGRFVLIVKYLDDYRIFHDPCGLRSVFYTRDGQDFCAASQPLLIGEVTDIKKVSEYEKYFSSEYVNTNKEHWIPSGISLYQNVFHLIPNHYLDVATCEQVRYWPNEPICHQSLEESLDKFTELLSNIMTAVNNRYKISLPLTAGWDSRVILSACKDIKDELWFYTLKFRDLSELSNDIKIPKSLASKLELDYHIIDCNRPLDSEFSENYIANSDIPHLHDWGEMANAMDKDYPKEYITIKGNCSEIGRCSYSSTMGKSRQYANTDKDLLSYEDGWREFDFLQKGILRWLDGFRLIDRSIEYDIYDLFYWEHRMGSWQARNQLEFDIVQEAFTPFNNRQLLDIMLRIDSQYRCAPSNLLFKLAVDQLWPEIMSEPVNPKIKANECKLMIKNVLIKLKIFNVVKKIRSKFL